MKKPKHPYLSGLLGWSVITLFFCTPALIRLLGFWQDLPLIVLLIPGLIFMIILVITWLIGIIELNLATDFLNSERPLIKWTYTKENWLKMKDLELQESLGDPRLAFWALTILFSIVGLLVGLMGIDDINFLVITLIGAAFGMVLGGIVSLSILITNIIAEREKTEEPGQVAIGETEILSSNRYVKFRGKYNILKDVTFKKGSPSKLVFAILCWGPRRRRLEKWSILIPSHLEEQVKTLLPIWKKGINTQY